ncbi:CSLREA domain-containing protein [Hahella sp. HN01]|uniref:CSLREA domain-containing protein n=1 Tax=unclassified Hahella TaxID=2624107 RepID=UPI001C1ED3D7|nr:CSLREA domain-containing protein [Hahella sp. HN01]MBU6953267.1 CSLREA domain-containing protein [Hahella sp. HN01]
MNNKLAKSYSRLTSSLTLGALIVAAPAGAASFQVTKFTDGYDGVCDSDCSLREAIQQANENAGPDKIILDAGVYKLSIPADSAMDEEDENLNGDLDILDDLVIEGQGIDISIIDADGLDRAIEVLKEVKVEMRGFTIRNGNVRDYGGGIENYGELMLRQMRITGNVTKGELNPGNGGGISNEGMLDIYQSILDDNRAQGDEAHGGAIYNTGSLFVRETTFENNSSENESLTGAGGAIYNRGVADISRTTFANNVADSTGSAFLNDDAADLWLSNSTLSGNIALGENGATLVNGVTNPTLQGVATMKVVHVTLADNTGHGFYNYGDVNVRNSLMLGNHLLDNSGFADCADYGVSYRNKGLMTGIGAGNCKADMEVASEDVFTQVLYPLMDNSGLTKTHRLRETSPAIDAGMGLCARTDQRRVVRPKDGNGDGVENCDLGSFEFVLP